jgi:Family of unknown function (DUF6064)
MPFTVEQFFGVFAQYNAQVWPLQIAALLAGLIAVGLLSSNTRAAAAAILAILSAMWLVNGVGYHWLHFATINPAARLFAVVFVLEAVLLAAVAVARPKLRFRASGDLVARFGLVCILFALALYPVIGWLAGHRYPAMPMFGIAPCPTTIFTIGMLLQGPWREVRWLLAIPGLWAGIGGSASFLLGVPQDYALLVVVLALVVLAFGQWRGWLAMRLCAAFRQSATAGTDTAAGRS